MRINPRRFFEIFFLALLCVCLLMLWCTSVRGTSSSGISSTGMSSSGVSGTSAAGTSTSGQQSDREWEVTWEKNYTYPDPEPVTPVEPEGNLQTNHDSQSGEGGRQEDTPHPGGIAGLRYIGEGHVLVRDILNRDVLIGRIGNICHGYVQRYRAESGYHRNQPDGHLHDHRGLDGDRRLHDLAAHHHMDQQIVALRVGHDRQCKGQVGLIFARILVPLAYGQACIGSEIVLIDEGVFVGGGFRLGNQIVVEGFRSTKTITPVWLPLGGSAPTSPTAWRWRRHRPRSGPSATAET